MLTRYFLLNDLVEGIILVKSAFINNGEDLLIKVNNLKTGQNYKTVVLNFIYTLNDEYDGNFGLCLFNLTEFKDYLGIRELTADEYEQILNF